MGIFDFLKKKKLPVVVSEDINEQRAQQVLETYGFDFSSIEKQAIVSLLEEELAQPIPGSAEYIRVLCGYLYCLGDEQDAVLLEKAKYGIGMDVGAMIDEVWIESLKTGAQGRPKAEIVNDFISYYTNF